MNERELLAYVSEERRRSIGFDNDAELIEQRERALNYTKGFMPDMPTQPNRSRAVSTDVADTIETILPDLVEIFTGGDDVAVFEPFGEEDEEAAQQETDYINHVVFKENDGWLTLYTFFKDALQSKTGVVKYAWEDGEEIEEIFERRSAVALQTAAETGEIVAAELCPPEPGDEEQYFDFTVKRKKRGRVCVMAVPPEDFTVAADTTVKLQAATYCAMRSRPRAQDLLAQGHDKAKIDALSAYGPFDTGVAQARDTVAENDLPQNGSEGPLRRVEVVEHYIRIFDGKQPKLWRVLTGNNEDILIEREEVDRIPFAAITPYIVTHRFYGESVADKVLEIQKIKTAITRMMLDSGYFALNQRMQVSETDMSANTIPDLLRNEPGVPIRSKTGLAVTPVQSGAPNFDFFGALEYFATEGEKRTGVVRAAQGLTPDTLHETAKGALALLTQAQKRVRLIARIFAETGVKDLFLGVHALIRKHADQKAVVRLRSKWVDIDPTSWGERADMSIEVGVGAAGKEAELAMLAQQGALLEQVIAMQGGPTGPIVNVENVYNFTRMALEKSGMKAPEKFITDPKEAGPPPPPQPDPAVVEAQAKAELAREEATARLTLDAEKAKAQGELDREKAALNNELERERAVAEITYKREVAQAEIALKREQLEAELILKREQMGAELDLKREQIAADIARNNAKVSADIGEVGIGGNPG